MERRLSKNRYIRPPIPNSAELDAALNTDDVDALRRMVIAVTALGEDADRATGLVRQLLRHKDELVRGNAVLGIGHIARRFGSVPADLLPRLRAAKTDPSDYVRGHAASAADDLRMFGHIDIPDK
jgi:hypothetical protein